MRPVWVKLASYLAATSLAAFTLAVYLLATKYTWCVPFGFHLFAAVAPLLACMVLVYFVNERFLSQVVLGLVLTLFMIFAVLRIGIITGLFDRKSEYRIRSVACLFDESV